MTYVFCFGIVILSSGLGIRIAACGCVIIEFQRGGAKAEIEVQMAGWLGVPCSSWLRA